ncbi:MAG: LLM class flavin-dependent oxidoreductase, partial [Dehalococcoidia bacterium]
SHGRLILGVGIGGDFPQELEMLGVRMKDRAKMSDEALTVIKRLLTEKTVTHQGQFFRFQDVTIGVPPGDLAPIPVWYGAEWHNGIADAVLIRTARFCDGFIPLGVPFDAYADVREKVETYAHQEGRDLSSFVWGLYLWCLLGESREEARREAEGLLQVKLGPDWRLENAKSYALGTPRDFIETIEKYISAGVSHFIISPVCIGGQVMSQYETLAREVLPHFKKKHPKPTPPLRP